MNKADFPSDKSSEGTGHEYVGEDMLEPREADIPALFLVLVVLPLVTYFLLGKWHETSKKKERIKLLAQLAAEEALRAKKMPPMAEIPVGSSSKTGFHECARCFGLATTRCARCKSVRYCSGKCQIIHWRQGHKQECQQLDISNSISSPDLAPISRSGIPWVLQNENHTPTFFKSDIKGCKLGGVPSRISSHPPTPSTDKSSMFQAEQKLSDKKARHNLNIDREISESEVKASFHNVENSTGNISTTQIPNATHSGTSLPSKEASMEHKDLSNFGSFGKCDVKSSAEFVQIYSVPGCTVYGPRKLKSQNGSGYQSSCPIGILEPLLSERNGTSPTSDNQSFYRDEGYSSNEPSDLSSSKNGMPIKESLRSKTLSHNLYPAHAVPQRSMPRESREYSCLQTDRKAHMENSFKIPVHRSNGISKTGDRKLLRPAKRAPAEDKSDSLKRNKVLFPYEEFVKLFHYEAVGISPRGLLNCGNSCYANAVLQCLTYTRPLIIYLLRKSHSGTCWTKDWCLMCELEQHVLNLVKDGGPLSLIRILSHMRNIGCEMGAGSQEDAHEFLRLLVTSMQSVCLGGLGGEKEIDLRLQETTLIQQTFSGCLRSKVKCLRCQHESKRYENIMDLTLEILGWVESLEDALAQFTAPEDLDGDNVYKCGRCTAYVKARKQLSIHEAPNILTIVLKRFQTGKYGKINKCITFPDLLDMIPYMTGNGDSPPLYILYGVVVHLDTLNASFSGHYVSYVKDLHGTWFRIDEH